MMLKYVEIVSNSHLASKVFCSYLLYACGSNVGVESWRPPVGHLTFSFFLLADLSHEFGSQSPLPCTLMDLDEAYGILQGHLHLLLIL